MTRHDLPHRMIAAWVALGLAGLAGMSTTSAFWPR